jgi:hypothetical protein
LIFYIFAQNWNIQEKGITDEELESWHGTFTDLDLTTAFFSVSIGQPISFTLRNDHLTHDYRIQLKTPFSTCCILFETIETIMWCVYIWQSSAPILTVSTIDFSDPEDDSERSPFTCRTVNKGRFRPMTWMMWSTTAHFRAA